MVDCLVEPSLDVPRPQNLQEGNKYGFALLFAFAMVSILPGQELHGTYASSPVWPPALANRAALSRLDLAKCTRFNATSKLNSERIPSNLEFMIAAFAANSVVGGDAGDIRPEIIGVPGRDISGFSCTVNVFEFAYGLASEGFGSGAAGLAAKAEGMTETGISITFLNVDRKSRLSASRLMLLMKNDSAAASSSRIFGMSAFS